MHIQHNYLRMHRKKAGLAQSDIAYIAALNDHSNVSRWENGTREPGLDTLLVYGILFGVPIEAFFERQREGLVTRTRNLVAERSAELRQMPADRKLNARVAFMEAVFKRLAQTEPKP